MVSSASEKHVSNVATSVDDADCRTREAGRCGEEALPPRSARVWPTSDLHSTADNYPGIRPHTLSSLSARTLLTSRFVHCLHSFVATYVLSLHPFTHLSTTGYSIIPAFSQSPNSSHLRILTSIRRSLPPTPCRHGGVYDLQLPGRVRVYHAVVCAQSTKPAGMFIACMHGYAS